MRFASSELAVLIFEAKLRTAIGLVPGNISRKNSSRFDASSVLPELKPVMFASGRVILVTKPALTRIDS